MVAILMMSANGLLKMKVFLNEGYNAIASVHDVTNKILLRDLNYIEDVIILPQFDNCSISVREVFITSIL